MHLQHYIPMQVQTSNGVRHIYEQMKMGVAMLDRILPMTAKQIGDLLPFSTHLMRRCAAVPEAIVSLRGSEDNLDH